MKTIEFLRCEICGKRRIIRMESELTDQEVSITQFVSDAECKECPQIQIIFDDYKNFYSEYVEFED